MNPVKFTASTSWADAIKDLTKEQRCEIYDAIFSYASTKTVPKMRTDIAIAFAFIKIDIDLSIEASEKRKVQLRKNASKGGKATQSKRTNKNQSINIL